MRKALLVGESDRDRQCAPARLADVLEIRAFVGLERRVDRARGNDRREERRVRGFALDQIADGDLGLADAAIDRRRHSRVGEIESGGLERRLIGANLRVELSNPRRRVVVLALRGRLIGKQLLVTRKLGPREIELRAGVGERRFGARHLGGKRPRIDDEEEITLAHLRARLEVDRLDIAVDARAHLDRFDGFDAPGKLVGLDDVAQDGGGDADRRRPGRRAALGIGLAAGGKHRQGRQHDSHPKNLQGLRKHRQSFQSREHKTFRSMQRQISTRHFDIGRRLYSDDPLKRP